VLTFKQIVAGSRPKTLLVGVSGVLVGAFCAWSSLRTWQSQGIRYAAVPSTGRFVLLTVLCLLVATLLQVAVNFANDYSDGIRGTDAHRGAKGSGTESGRAGAPNPETARLVAEANGPVRLTASGVPPRSVLIAAIVSAALACVAGLAAVILTQQWWFILLGIVCVAAAWFYTGGSHPYGYMGLGELFVFIFFGLVVTLGTQMLLLGGAVDFVGILGALAQGCLAVCVMMVNNLRDISADTAAGKRTLEVRLGERASRVLFVFLLVIGIVYSFGAAYLRSSYEGMIFCLATALMGAILVSSVLHRRYLLALPVASGTVFVNALIYLLVALSS
jgi:1,4-dihydroxy-2-naphthoate octaprenyltransferase